MTLINIDTEELLDAMFMWQGPQDFLLIVLLIGAALMLVTRRPQVIGSWFAIMGGYFLAAMLIADSLGGTGVTQYLWPGAGLWILGMTAIAFKPLQREVMTGAKEGMR